MTTFDHHYLFVHLCPDGSWQLGVHQLLGNWLTVFDSLATYIYKSSELCEKEVPAPHASPPYFHINHLPFAEIFISALVENQLWYPYSSSSSFTLSSMSSASAPGAAIPPFSLDNTIGAILIGYSISLVWVKLILEGVECPTEPTKFIRCYFPPNLCLLPPISQR